MDDSAIHAEGGSNGRILSLDTLRVLLFRKGIIVGIALASGILAAIAVLQVKPTYTARATFLPPNSMSASPSMLQSQIGSLGVLGLKDPSMIFVGILESRAVADDLIQQFHLQDVYKTKRLSQTEKALAGHTKFLPAKDSLIAIAVEDHDPRRAADLANGYLKELGSQNDRLALTEAAQRRLFFEKQLEKEKDLLSEAEVELRRVQEQTGLIRPGGQEEVQIAAIAQTRAAISSREVELAALSQGATDQNPDMVRLRSEIAGLREQLSHLEDSSGKNQPGDVMVSTAKVPELTLEYARKDREVKYHEALYELLLRQYESARLDESRSAPIIQIVDLAAVPDTKSGPQRMLLVLLATFVGGFCSAACVVLPDVWKRKMQSPEFAVKWAMLKDAARFRRSRA